MRIGIFDPYLDDLGGGEKYMATIAQVLSKDNQVDIFWDEKKDIEELTQRFPLDLSKVNLTKNIFSRNVSYIEKIKESLKYDVIIILSDGSLPMLLSKKTFIHFQQPFVNISPNFKNSLKKTKITGFFCNSEFTKSHIDKEFGINSLVIYPPVDVKAKNMKKENIILNVGRFRVRDVTTSVNGAAQGIGDFKKQGLMLDVFKNMIKKGPAGWKLVFAVSVKKHEEGIFKKFKESAKGVPVEFVVNKNNDELWDIYSKAKIYWHASGFGEDLNNHPEFAEHFGISTVEAMGAGCVPVVIKAGGQKEIVTSGKDGFLWETLDEFKSMTLNLMQNNQLWEQISRNAKVSAKRFSRHEFEKRVKGLIL